MTKLYNANILEQIPESKMDLITSKFSHSIVDRIDNGFNKRYKLRQITTRLMLIEIFIKLNIDPKELKLIYYNEYGKLIVPNINLNISISYSENKAICGVSNSRIGVDIEHLRKNVGKKNKILLESLTKQKIESALDFYRVWTKTESIAKLYKTGGLNNLFVDKDFYKKASITNHLLLENNFLIAISS